MSTSVQEEHVPEPTAAPLPRASRAWIVWLILAVVAAGVTVVVVRGRKAASADRAQAAGAADRVVPVLEATVAVRDVPVVLEGLGNVLPLATVNVKSQVDGRLDKVLFTEGQRVKRGDVIAQVDPRPFTIQLHTAQAALARDTAQFRNAKLNLERYKTLVSQKLIPQQQSDDQQAQADQLEATLMTDQAQVESARLQLDYAQIKAPLDGVAGLRQVDPGNVVHPSDANGIVVLTQLDPIAVVFTLPQDDLPRVAKELAAGPVPVDAYARDGLAKLASGKLSVIDNEVSTQTATIKLKAIFPNAERALWPSAFIKARLLLTTRKGALVVPAAAVQRGPQGVFVYIIAADQTVSVRPIEIELTQGESAVVSKGLKAGERIVIDGQSQLRPGAKVAPRAQDGAPAGGAPSPESPARAAPGASARGATGAPTSDPAGAPAPAPAPGSGR